MIRRLKRKFVLTNMFFVTLVLAVTFFFVGYSTRQSLYKSSVESLKRHVESLVTNQQPAPPPDGKGAKSIRKSDNSSVVLSIQLSISGRMIQSRVSNENFELTDEDTQNLAKYCQKQDASIGTIEEYNLRYYKKEDSNRIRIAFYDLNENKKSMSSLYLSFVFVGTGSLAAFFILSLFLSKWLVRPIEEAWNRQRQFVADASHELKTPLTVILANTEILNSHPEQTIKSQSKWIGYIKEESQHMSHLVNDMLYLAKSDANRNPVQMQLVDFSEICEKAYLPFESVCYEKGIHSDVSIIPNLRIRGDAERLSQLCTILIDNACKYAPEKGRIGIALNAKGNHIHLLINNNGEIITKENLLHVFDRFYRVDEARTHTQNGYGLGLSVAKSIVHDHGGNIEMRSDYKEGITVEVTLEIK